MGAATNVLCGHSYCISRIFCQGFELAISLAKSDEWWPMETKFLSLRHAVELGSRFGDWEVCWLGINPLPLFEQIGKHVRDVHDGRIAVVNLRRGALGRSEILHPMLSNTAHSQAPQYL
jgi:hypothetical protein